MITVVTRFSNDEEFIAKVGLLGVSTRPAIGERGEKTPIEYRVGQCMTPILQTTTGRVARLLLTEEQAAKLPEVTSPNFLIDWKSDEGLEEVEYQCDEIDENGKSILVSRRCGVIN